MIIDLQGNELLVWYRKDGVLIFDKDNKYGIDFAIAYPYNEEQYEKRAQIKELKKYLKNTDYRALKYADGAYTEEEYAPYKKARAEARARINELEFEEPTLTREEIDAIEELYFEKIKPKEEEEDGGADNTTIS